MGTSGNVFVKSAVILIFLAALTVNGYENDDIVFDQDGRNAAIEIPLIERQHDQSLFQRVKRQLWGWFGTPTTTPTPTTNIPDGENQTTQTPFDQTEGADVMRNTLISEPKKRTSRESGEENSVDQTSPKVENNDVGNTAAGYPLPIYPTSDDEDLEGSGDIEGSAGNEDLWGNVGTDVPVRPSGQPQYYRITLKVIEPYKREYSDRHSKEYQELSGNVTKVIENLYRQKIPNFEHSANVVMISPLPDPFSTQVTIDLGSMFDDGFSDDLEIRQILEKQLQLHSLGSLQVGPDGFTFRKVQAAGGPECDENSEMRCRDGTCIPLSQRCDGIPQCHDDSDELDCPKESSTERCGDGEFACDVTRCILDSKRCDFTEDCKDGSDEHNCDYPACIQGEFKCRNSQCVALNLRCNGVSDCRDGSDEMNCPCKDDEFECTPLYCIPLNQRCDGVNHCSNERDEKDCDSTPTCRVEEFTCDDGSCVSLRSRCDGHSDCSDRSDERNCTVITCNKQQFRCLDGTCLELSKRCDRYPDCSNGEDEQNCGGAGCGPSEFSCNDGYCIPYRLQCNGVKDCSDGSDEQDCVKGKTGRRDDVNDAGRHDLQKGLLTTLQAKNQTGKGKIRHRDLRQKSRKIKHLARRKNYNITYSDSIRRNVTSNGYEIPSARKIGDPIIAAFPQFKSVFKKLPHVSDRSEENLPNKDWEIIDDNIDLAVKMLRSSLNHSNSDQVLKKTRKMANPHLYQDKFEYNKRQPLTRRPNRQIKRVSRRENKNTKYSDPIERNVTSMRFEIPSAGEIGDPILAAFPDLKSEVEKLTYVSHNSEEDSPKKDWEILDTDHKKNLESESPQSPLNYSNRNRVVKKPRITDDRLPDYDKFDVEDYDYDSDSTEDNNNNVNVHYETTTLGSRTPPTKAEIRILSDSRRNEQDIEEIFADAQKIDYPVNMAYPEFEEEAENYWEDQDDDEDISGEASGDNPDEYVNPYDYEENYYDNKSNQTLTTDIVETETNASTEPKNESSVIMTQQKWNLTTPIPISFETVGTIQTNIPEEDVRTTLRIELDEPITKSVFEIYKEKWGVTKKTSEANTTKPHIFNPKKDVEVILNRIIINPDEPKTKSIFDMYKEKWGVTKKTSAANAVNPQDGEITSNRITFDNSSKSEGKLYRYTKDVKVPEPSDVVNKILGKMRLAATFTSAAPPTMKTKVESARESMEKLYGENTSTTSDGKTTLSKTSSIFATKGHLEITKDSKVITERAMDSLKKKKKGANKETDAANIANGGKKGRKKGSVDWKNFKVTKKPELYGGFKVESGLYEKRGTKVNLAERLEFDDVPELTKEETIVKNNIKEILTDNRGPDECVKCASYWKKKYTQSIANPSTKTIKTKQFPFENDNKQNVDSGLDVSSENCTELDSETHPTPDGPQDSESREIITVTTKCTKTSKNFETPSRKNKNSEDFEIIPTMRSNNKKRKHNGHSNNDGKNKKTTNKEHNNNAKKKKPNNTEHNGQNGKKKKPNNTEHNGQNGKKKKPNNKEHNGQNGKGNHNKKRKQKTTLNIIPITTRVDETTPMSTGGLRRSTEFQDISMEMTFGWTGSTDDQQTKVINEMTTIAYESDYGSSEGDVNTATNTPNDATKSDLTVKTTSRPCSRIIGCDSDESNKKNDTPKTTTTACDWFFGCESDESNKNNTTPRNSDESNEKNDTPKTTTTACNWFFGCESDESNGNNTTPRSETTEKLEPPASLSPITIEPCISDDCRDSEIDRTSEVNTESPSSIPYQSGTENLVTISSTLDSTISSGAARKEDSDSLESSVSKEKRSRFYDKSESPKTVFDSEETDTMFWSTTILPDIYHPDIEMEGEISEEILHVNAKPNPPKWKPIGETTENIEKSTAFDTIERNFNSSKLNIKETRRYPSPFRRRCHHYQHNCDGSRCISMQYVCNGVDDCNDSSDETFCPLRLWRMKKRFDGERCRDDQLACDKTLCLEQGTICDGIPHCHDGTDETECDDWIAMKEAAKDNQRARYRNRLTIDERRPTTSYPGALTNQENQCHPEWQFKCNDGNCIEDVQECDGHKDCAYGEDEDDCSDTPFCPDGQTACDNGVCIDERFICDHREDCLDGSDEARCPDTNPDPQPCTRYQFTCRDGSCIPREAHCDGHLDCPDGDDEDCVRECSDDQFHCRSGDCISIRLKCDGLYNCDDGSDEEDCIPETTPSSRDCSVDQFTCVRDRTCVHSSSRCNGIPECRDNSDEEDCDTEQRTGLDLKTRPSEQVIKESREVVFQCRDEGSQRAKVHWLRGNGRPLPPGSRDINGRLEIPNIQLEHAGTYICEAIGYPPSTPGRQVTVQLEVEKLDLPITRPPQVCKYDEATCSNGDCIPKSSVCNGKYDCTDGSDEMRCNPHGCEPNQFRCANKECVSKVWRCDGDKDCRDGTDEENCEPPPPGSPCRYDEYQCAKYDQCIPKSYHCDMERDCQDGSDEFGCSPVYITKPPPGMITLHVGETMILTCSAVGVPVPEINWRLNWGHVPSKCYSTSHNGTGTLTCPDIQVADQGAYSCEALNPQGFVFAVPDTILVVTGDKGPCRPGTFNDEARTADECISCFCFGVSNTCKSANLFTYQLRPPFDRFRVVSVETSPALRIQNEVSSQVAEVRPRGSYGADISAPYNRELTSYNVPYFAIPQNFYGPSSLKSYGGYLKYNVSYSGNGRPNNSPDVILSGNGFVLVHRGSPLQPNTQNYRQVRFFYGEWYKNDRGQDIRATREEIMMVLAKVDHILIKAKYEDSPDLQVSITDIVMDTAEDTNVGLGAASYVEECTCPTGYYGYSCESCAPGFIRRTSGPWLGECYLPPQPNDTCKEGFYGDPLRNIPCERCACPLTNPANQFARTCHLGAGRNPVCDCLPEYSGPQCQYCAEGYVGNPRIPGGGKCVRKVQCNPDGSLTPDPDAEGKCRCKAFATGLLCDQCKANTFNLASKNQFGCVDCFCMGISNRCTSSNWFRNEIRVPFTNSIRNFTLIESNTPDAKPISEGIYPDASAREIVYNGFSNRGNAEVYYWQLPNIFLGNRVTSYGGDLQYTVRYVPSPGGQSSRNNAADVVLYSGNDIILYHYSRETPESNTPQTFTVPLLEQYWQRIDGTQANRDHFMMVLADVEDIRIKATYTTHTDEAALSQVSLDIAEKYNTGKERAYEVEECSCPVGYRGLSCEDCAPGYTKAFTIYLLNCKPCSCNGHSTQCDPKTGVCENCGNHTMGENCELCEPGYEGDATRGGCTWTGGKPTTCDCDPAGSESDQCVDGRCHCKGNVEGARCNRCRPSTFGLSADNIDGCNACYCSGVTDECHESSLYIQPLPMFVYDSHHGFTLTDSSRLDVIDDGFIIDEELNEIGYRFSNNRNRRLFWSLPATFTGNKVKSYGGKLTVTQHITALPNSQILKDQDVLLIGNGITLFWTNPQEILPGIPMTYSVLLRETEWRRLSTAGPRRASRTDLMTVLSNLDAILVRASHSEGMTATYISDVSLDSATENRKTHRATQIEACRCPPGYSGTSCETCAPGYYRDLTNRSVSVLGSCNVCPCNNHEESCEISGSGQIRCNCRSGYGGYYCQDIVDDQEPQPTLPPVSHPKIEVTIQEKKFQIVQTGSTVRLHCSGRSVDNAPLRIQWEKEGSISLPDRSSDDYNGLLIIRDIRVSDSGIYVCRVTDGINIVFEKVSIAVGGARPEAPRATIRPSYLQVKEGEPVRFQCEATGNPEPEIEWIRVQGPMNPEARYWSGTLHIPAALRSDAAQYKCIARNEVGVDEQTTVVYVSENPERPHPDIIQSKPPTITPTQWTGSAGDAVRLICTRSNYHASVSWIRSGNLALPQSFSQRDGVLTIGNPIPTDSGIYICTASSFQGTETSTSANVTIFPKRTHPSVRVEPERQTVSQGTEAEIRCIADRDSGLQIKWVKYGEPLLGPNARQIGDVLKIMSPQVSDRGVYICRASNSAGSYEASAIVEVTPRESPILELHPKESQIVNLGGSADIQCRVTAGIPMPDVHWNREDGRQFSSNIQQLPGGLLRLTNVSMHDGGAYRCSASNTVGSTSAIARIEVQSLPIITVTPPGGIIYTKRGARVMLTCTAQGLPQPTVAWMKSRPGVAIYSFARRPEASRLSAVHEIMSMSPDDEGSYTCQAINAAGVTEERVQIRIEDDNSVSEIDPDEPTDHNGGVRIPNDSLSVPSGGTVTIRCQVYGPTNGPRISIDWRRSDRRSLPVGSYVRDHALTIENATRDAAGEYVCLGIDPSGREVFRARAHVDVVSLPNIKLNPSRQTVRPGESPAIVCTATGDQPMTIEWDAIGRDLPYSVSKDRGVLQFNRITYTDAGKYVCKARNNAGIAEAVAEVLVSENTVDDPVIRAVDRDIVTFPGSTVTLRCDVRPRSVIEWTKNGRSLGRNVRVGEDYIELTNVQPEDGGTYTCQVRTSHGTSNDYINLRVEEAQNTAVTIEPSQNVVNIGDMIDLRCTYTGTDSPKYHWTRPNHVALPINSLEHGNILRISNIELSESGVYRCHVITQDGSNYDGEYDLIVQGGNDAPAIETKYVPYGKGLEMRCRPNLDGSVDYQWTKLGGLLPEDTETYDNILKLNKVKAEDAGTYICQASNGHASTEVPTVLVVTGVVPNFHQAPKSWISLAPLADSYLKFSIEVSFKPENYDGIIFYNDETVDGTGDYIMLALAGGYPEFHFDLGSGAAVIRADKPVSLGEWHTIKLLRNRKEGTMLVDGEGPYKAINSGKKQGLDLKGPLYIGGVPDYNAINPQAHANTGFVGCISRLVLGDRSFDLIGEQTDSVGVTTCETCAENPCNNAGVCQEASTKNGYRCLCRAGYSGKHCDSIGQPCYPGACGDGQCVDKENDFECYCPHGKSGPRCELFTANLNEPAFRDDRAYLAYPTPTAGRRGNNKRNAVKAKRSHNRSSHVTQLKKGRSRSAHQKHRNVHNTKH